MLHFRRLLRSFFCAGRGLVIAWQQEQSFRIQVFAAALIIILIFYFQVKVWEAVALLLLIIFVLVLELMNSTLERIVDVFKPRIHPFVEDVKDIMAGIVLIASLGALLVGLIIFWPYIAR